MSFFIPIVFPYAICLSTKTACGLSLLACFKARQVHALIMSAGQRASLAVEICSTLLSLGGIVRQTGFAELLDC